MSLADVWGQEAFHSLVCRVACDARNVAASVLAGCPGSRDDMLVSLRPWHVLLALQTQ